MDKNKLKSKIQSKIQFLRTNQGKTQRDVANGAGISIITYQRYEYGDRVPNACIASTIATIVGRTVYYIMRINL